MKTFINRTNHGDEFDLYDENYSITQNSLDDSIRNFINIKRLSNKYEGNCLNFVK